MSDVNWEELAEIYINTNNNNDASDKEYIYCLCSRVLIKNNQFDVISIEQEELSEAYDAFLEQDCSGEINVSAMNRVPKEFSQEEEDSDAISCYYSASASHTENYCTTDEHERDSGADISEYHGACGVTKKLPATAPKSVRPRNNSLPDEMVETEVLEGKWEKFWSQHGERIIWSSWIEKYSDFISPSYKNLCKENKETDTSPHLSDERNGEAPEETERELPDNIGTSIIVSACSSGARCTPIAGVNEDTTDGPLRDMMDSLLIPRCDSVTSSIPLTIGTTDSMTNVTHMTLSSYGFCSSQVSSENSQLSGSTPSSLSAPFEFDDNDETRIELLEEDDTDSRWQILWQRHFQEQYTKNYTEFKEKFSPAKARLSKSLQQDNECDELFTFNEDEAKQMAEMGLPIAFGRFGRGHMKRNYTRNADDNFSDRVKSAFILMGYSFLNDDATDESLKTSGHVVYRKRNIRLHNNMLKMKKKKLDYEGLTGKDDVLSNILAESSSDEADSTAANVPSKMDSGEPSSANIPQSLPTVPSDDEKQMESILTDNDEQAIEIPATAGNTDEINFVKNTTKRSKKKRRQNKTATGLPTEIANDKTLIKYWRKRFSLFSLFDLGIKLDRESWFSVTPEKVAAFTANRLQCDTIVDAFCGAGGNTIQFAKTCGRVIAIDIDPKKVEMAKHNASIYGVADRIEFIVGDFLQLASSFKADIVFLSPPWGGPQYLKQEVYDIEKSILPVPASKLIKISRQISQNIAIYLPRNSNTHQLVMIAGPGHSVEIEQSFLDHKLIAITALYGNLIKKSIH